MERLESREMLAATHLADFEGTVTSADEASQVSLTLAGFDQHVVLSLQLDAAPPDPNADVIGGELLNPFADRLEDSTGTPITALAASGNSIGQTRVVNYLVPAGDFNLFVRGEQNTTGNFIATLTLPGDVSGDGQVSDQEQQAAIAAVVQSQFGFNNVSSLVFANLGVDVTANLYDVGLDADLNGVVDTFDLDVISTNMNLPSILAEFATDMSAPDIMAAVNGDTGRSNSDGITNNLSMTIDGTISDDNLITGFTASVDGSAATDVGTFLGQDFSAGGSFSLNLGQLETIAGTGAGSLTNTGTHTLSLTAQDGESNASVQPFEVTFNLDTIVPAAPAMPDLNSASDTGDSATDNVTNQNVLTVDTDAEDNSLVELFSSLVGGPIGDGIVNSPVTIPTDPLPSGMQDITGTATDPAGNTGGSSDPLTVTIDNTPPAAPIFDLDAGSDTGTIGDHLTTESLVTIAGTTEANASVQLRRGGSAVASGTADGSGNFSFAGVSLPFGASEFTVTAGDAAGNSSSSVEIITRNDAPLVDDQSLSVAENSPLDTLVGIVVASDANLGEGDSLQFTITGGNGAAVFNIDEATGAVTVADASQLDFETMPEFTVTVRVSDTGGDGSGTPGTGLSDTAIVTITVDDANDPPVTSDATFGVPENSPVDTAVGTVTASDQDAGDTHTFAITGGNTNSAFAIEANNGEITVANSAALNFESQSTFTLTVTATDSGGMSDTASVTVNVTDVNEPPTVPDQAFSASSSVSDGFMVGTISVNDPDAGDTFAFEVTGSDPTTSLFTVNPSTGAISVPDASGLTPDTSFVLTVQVTDMGGAGFSDLADITISIIPNVLPIAADDTVSTDEDTSLGIDVLADNGNGADSDPDGDDALLSVTAFDATSVLGATIPQQVDGSLLYNPTGVAAFQALGVGAMTFDSFTYQVSDADNGTDSATVSITISGVNDMPTAVNDERATDEETVITFDPLSDNGNGADSDPDTGDVLSVVNVDAVSNFGATVTLNGNGTVSYDPNSSAALQALSAADSPVVDTFIYSISDGNGGSDTATVSVTVSGVDESVTAVGEVFQIDQGSGSNSFPVVANDSTSSGAGTLSVTSAITTVSGAMATPSGDGQSIDYTPAPGFLGRDMVTYTVEDAGGGSDTAIVTVEVTTGPSDLQDHIHASLSVFVDGVLQADPPVNIGVASQDASGTVFTAEVHTHGTDGRIHAHPVSEVNEGVKTEFSILGDFFDTWRTNAGLAGNNPDSIFNENQIYDNVVDQDHVIQMFVNGLPNTDFEKYVIEDEDQIVIVYESISDVEMPDILPIADVDLLGGSPLHVELDGFDLQHEALTYTATSSNPSLVAPTVLSGNRNMVVTVADFGVMNFQLFDGRAPRVTAQISALAPDYSGVPFHRVEPGFVIQGGDITNGNGTGGSSLGDFDDQFHIDLQHNRAGLLSMAKSGDDTNDSQFFVTAAPTRHLDFNHSIFGLLVEGDRVRSLINNVDRNGSTPATPVLMDNVQIITDMENGVLMLKAAEGALGEADVTVTVTDSAGNMFSRTFHVTVTPDTLDGAPFLGELPATVTAATGQPATIAVDGGASALVQDVEGDPFVVDVLDRGSAAPRFTFELNGAMDQITVTPLPGVTGTLPVQLQVRPTERSNTGRGFDPDTQNVDIVFGDASSLTAQLPAPATSGDSAAESAVSTASLQSQTSTIGELVHSAIDVWADAIELDTTIDVAVELADLPDNQLGEAITTEVDAAGLPLAGTIILDADAAGAAWHADIATEPSDGAFDLFTVILHEVGHLLGFDQALGDYQADRLSAPELTEETGHAHGDRQHLDSELHPGDLMTAALPVGTRRAPSAFDSQVLRSWYEDADWRVCTATEEYGAVDTVYEELGAA